MEKIEFKVYPSSLGNIFFVMRDGKLIRLGASKEAEYVILKKLRGEFPWGVESDTPFKELCILMDRYLKGQNTYFSIEVDLKGETAFTRRVLEETKKIPYGETRSYRDIARAIGMNNAARAVGQALKRNPVPIIIPCHRVICEDRTLGGFSMKNVSKRYLLRLEGVLQKDRPAGGRKTG